jgi:hypothetical protein
MKRFVLALGLAVAAIFAAQASANVPNGKGLELLESPIPLVCNGDQETLAVVVTPGNGATGWRVDVNGQEVNQHHVLSYFAITVGGVKVTEKSWGVKQGLDSLECSQYIAAFDTLIEGTIYPLPGGGS